MKISTKLTLAAAALPMLTVPGVHADDIRIVNANIITMDDANPTADTLLIGGNRIVSVGADPSGEGGDSGEVTVIDAGGAVAIPGIIDQHLHWNRSAIAWGHALHRGESAFTLQDLEVALRERAAEVPDGEWIALIGRHNHRQFLDDGNDPQSGRYPTRQELDQWVPNHPVLFSQRFAPAPVGTGPDDFNRANFSGPGQMNSLAIAFFSAMTPAMPFVAPIPDDGALSDELSQQVYEWTRANNTLDDQMRSTLDLARWSHRVGLVGVGDAGGSGFRQTQDFVPLAELARGGRLKVRNRFQLRPSGAPGVAGQAGVDALRNVLSAAPLAESRQCAGPPEIAGEGFQISRLGGPFLRNMGLGEFLAAPTADSIEAAAIFLLRRPDWSVHQHAEAGQISRVIEGYRRAAAAEDPCRIGTFADRHNSLEHLNDATEENLADMAELGLGAGIQAVRFLFPDWQFSGPPYRAAVDTPGLNVGFGADGLVYEGEHERGQLRAGYLADLVILNQNPFEVDARRIRETEAAITIVDGEVVYSNGSL